MINKLKEKKYIVFALLMIPLMILGSLLVSFDIMDAFYLFIILISIIAYIRCG